MFNRNLKVIPFGAQVHVEVFSVEIAKRRDRSWLAPACGEVNAQGVKVADAEGWICIYQPGTTMAHLPSLAKPGDLGILTFTEGGPMGGYWDYKPKEI